MSRIGKKIIIIPDKVTVSQNGSLIMVKGPKGELSLTLPNCLTMAINGSEITLTVADSTEKKQNALWGTYRQLIANLIEGATAGFSEQLDINGVGYKWEIRGQELVINVGYSHPVIFKIPAGLELKMEKTSLIITGCDKQLVGEAAASIRKIKKPEPYKGKGIKYAAEVIRRKAGKQVKSAAK